MNEDGVVDAYLDLGLEEVLWVAVPTRRAATWRCKCNTVCRELAAGTLLARQHGGYSCIAEWASCPGCGSGILLPLVVASPVLSAELGHRPTLGLVFVGQEPWEYASLGLLDS